VNPDLLSLKRRWLPLFAAGVALSGAGLALFLLWLYRNSPLVELVVGLLTPPSGQVPPRGTLVSLTALLFTVIGVTGLLVAVRRINASEIGEIDSFWWKVAVATLAGRWWLGEPRVAVVGSRQIETVLPVLRGLKAFTGRVTLVLPPGTPDQAAIECLVALAEDEAGVQRLIERLQAEDEPFDLSSLSAALRLRGRLEFGEPTPRLADTISRADAILFGPATFDTAYGPEVAGWLRAARTRKIGLSAIVGIGSGPAATLREIAAGAGGLDAGLVNSNTVPPLADGQHYLAVPSEGEGAPQILARDVVDWADPCRHDSAKLAIFLREAILRG
jgi:hypothetical protein